MCEVRSAQPEPERVPQASRMRLSLVEPTQLSGRKSASPFILVLAPRQKKQGPLAMPAGLY